MPERSKHFSLGAAAPTLLLGVVLHFALRFSVPAARDLPFTILIALAPYLGVFPTLFFASSAALVIHSSPVVSREIIAFILVPAALSFFWEFFPFRPWFMNILAVFFGVLFLYVFADPLLALEEARLTLAAALYALLPGVLVFNLFHYLYGQPSEVR